jgi:hypothetical protein
MASFFHEIGSIMVGSILFSFMVNRVVRPDLKELNTKIDNKKPDAIPTSWKHSDHFHD